MPYITCSAQSWTTNNSSRLIALLLGRLHLTTEQALTEYSVLTGEVFKERKTRWLGNDGKYKATKLETVVKALVQKYGAANDPDESLLDERAEAPGACKAFIVSHPTMPQQEGIF